MPDIFVQKEKAEKPIEKPAEKAEDPYSFQTEFPTEAGAFTSFAQNTRNVHFEEQDQDEEVLLFTRAHFAVNLKWILWLVFLFFIPPVFIFLNTISPFFSIPILYGFAFLALFYLTLFVFFFIGYITWYYNISLVTNKRILDIDFADLIYHDVATTKLPQIEDINYSQTGVFQSFFNFGDLFFQTSGEKAHFDFLGIPTPKKASMIVHELIGKVKHAGH